MRGRFIAVGAVLIVCGLALFWGLRSSGPEDAEDGATLAPLSRGDKTSPVSPSARSRLAEDGAPSLARAPDPSVGFLAVEVLVGTRPVSGSEVRLYSRQAGAWRRVGSGVTDATGHVRLAAGAGGYLVAVRAPGHAPLLRDVVRPQGEALTSLRVLLEPGHTVVGRTVVAGTNEPLPLVELSFTAHARPLEPWQRAEAPDEERVFVHSDERGAFRVDGLAAGLWLLEARAPGHVRASLSRLRVPVEAPLTVALRLAGVIEGFVVDARGEPVANAEVRVGGNPSQGVTTGAQGGFSVEVEPGVHPVSARRGEEAGALEQPVLTTAGSTVRDVRIRLGPGAGLEGRVVEKTSGAAVAGARVEVSRMDGDGAEGEGLSDAEGHFEVRGLAPGSYDATVTAPGFAPTARRGLTVAQGERFPVELALARTGGVEGQVRDPSGAPVANARVSASQAWLDVPTSAPTEARTDAEGRYRLEGLAPGRLSVVARREGATVGVRRSVELGDEGPVHLDFTLEGSGTVEGRVRVARGSLPEGGLELTALVRGSQSADSPDVGRVTVGAEGTFRMVLAPGSYNLLLSRRDRFNGGAQQNVTVEEGRTVQVEFTWEDREAPEYRGVVLEPDGTPSPGASVALMAAGGQGIPMAMGAADADGRFALPMPQGEDAPKAKSRVVLVARQGGRASEALPVEAGRDVVARLRPGASLRGRVLRDGVPVRGFTVALHLQQGFLPDGGAGPWVFSGERYTLRDVPAEPVKVMARTADGAMGEVLVTPGSGAALELDIPLKPSATVRGRVVDAVTKAPMPDAFLFIEGEPPGADSVPDGEGRFTLRGVREGERVLVVVGPVRGAVRRTLRVEPGATVDLGDVVVGEPPAPAPSPR